MPKAGNNQHRTRQLSEIKRSLLKKRLLGNSDKAINDDFIPLRPIIDYPELSFAQQRLWFLHHLEPNNHAYNISFLYQLKGPLNVSAFEKSLNEVVNRHEALRTTFVLIDEKPTQVINNSICSILSVIDIQDLTEIEKEKKITVKVAEESHYSFDLSKGPVFRASLFKSSAYEHHFLFVVHHIAFDGWSESVLLKELKTLYQSFSSGQRPRPIPELPIQYKDFALWQREKIKGPELKNLLDYWEKHIGRDTPVLQLPTDRPRQTVQSFHGANKHFTISNSLRNELVLLSQRRGVTLFMTLLAAFNILIYRYSGQKNFLIGTPIANRNKPELEKLIGFFVNSVVLKSVIAGNPSFLALLTRMKDETLGAYDHQDMPFERLVEELKPDRDMSYTPLFQVMFALQNVPRDSFDLKDLSMTPLSVETNVSTFDLSLYIQEREDVLTGIFEYNTDLFNNDSIERIALNYIALLRNLVAEPDTNIELVPLISVSETEKLTEWNETHADYPKDKCLYDLFESQALSHPWKIALECNGDSISYADLNTKANQLAHYLMNTGVGPDVLVGIFMDRSIDTIIGLLGVLKSGGAYVPLDPDYPKDRLSYMLSESRSPVLITQEKFKADLPESDAKVIFIDSDWASISEMDGENPDFTDIERRPAPENLAYVIFTSGSTGTPKGVQVPHRAVTNFLSSMSQKPGMSANDVLLAVTTLSFDIHVLELFLPLSVGGKLIITDKETSTDATKLAELLGTSGTTVMQATPSTWRLLIAAGWTGSKQLKVLCGGEAFPKDLAVSLLERADSVWNMYGPTETTVWSTCYQLMNADGPILIGRPIGNTQTYVLDKNLQPVPIGVPGELYIGGDGVTHGYINRQDLTSKAFIPDPFSGKPNSLIYKTGDLVKYHSDGNIEYIDRMDNQVKLRGYRIELGEVETALEHHSAINQSVVVIKNFGALDQRLVAYYQCKDANHVNSDELRNFLKKMLPDYMIPQHFMELPTFPLTPAGKTDRKNMPPIAQERIEKESYFAPRNEMESELAEIWMKVLKIDRIGIQDNFFEIGGHSLLGVQIVNQLRKRYKINLTVSIIFEAPTIERMGCVIENKLNEAVSTKKSNDARLPNDREIIVF